jgi:hypothetical protein
MVRITEYLKKSQKWLNPDAVKDGDVVELVGEGAFRTVSFGGKDREVFETDVKLADGTTKTWTMNRTTMKNLSEAWGEDTKQWAGKKVRLTVQTVLVRGEMKRSIVGYPVTGEEEPVKKFMKELELYYPNGVDFETLQKLLKIRGFDVKPEEAAKLAGLKVVEKEGKKLVVWK